MQKMRAEHYSQLGVITCPDRLALRQCCCVVCSTHRIAPVTALYPMLLQAVPVDGVTDMSLLSEALSEVTADPSTSENDPQRPPTPQKTQSPGRRDSRSSKGPRDTPPEPEPDDAPPEPPAGSSDAADWAVSFEQFVASVLTEPLLVAFFEKRADVSGAVTQLRSVRLNRQTSLSFSTSPTAEASGVL